MRTSAIRILMTCRFGTYVGWNLVAESVVWAKLRTLVAGAALASHRLWG